jgi:hypothetical protein
MSHGGYFYLLEAGNFGEGVKAPSDIADYTVVGVVSTSKRSVTDGIPFATGTAVFRVIDERSGRIVANAVAEIKKRQAPRSKLPG